MASFVGDTNKLRGRLIGAAAPDALIALGTAQVKVPGEPLSGAADSAPVDLFVRLIGRFAGDVALTLKATGGVYVAGGVAQKLGPLLDAAIFRAAFENHPPYQELLAAIPTSLMMCAEPGLLGCAALAGRMFAEPCALRSSVAR